MIKTDYHTHSSHSSDSTTKMEDMINTAITLGLEEYAITDHIDFDYPHGEIINSPYGIAANVKAIRAMQEKFAGKIKVLVGAEFSLRTDVADIARHLAQDYAFDFIIGSAHDAKGIDFFWPEFQYTRTKQEVHTEYYENMLEMVQTCDAYDVVGHFDYINRRCDYTDKAQYYANHREIIDAILKVIIQNGKGVEINTAGIAYGMGYAHPQIEVLQRYLQLSGEIITVGSDAHRPESIAQHFDVAYDILQQLGVKYITRFDKRKPRFVKL